MRVRIIISVVLMSWGMHAFSQGVTFSKLDNLNIPDGSLNMIRSVEGNYLSTGYWDDDSWLMKLNPCGGIIWSKTYNAGPERSFSFDVVERPTASIATVQQIDTLVTLLDTFTYRLPTARIVETDQCGTILDEEFVRIPVENSFGINLLTPTAPFGVDNTTLDGLVVTGQTIYLTLTDTMPLDGTTKKTAFLATFDFNLTQQNYTVFPEFPDEDTLVGYDVLTLPNHEGYLVSGAYFDSSVDSLYLLTLRTDTALTLQWSRIWAPAPRSFLPPTGGINLTQYHAATAMQLTDDGRLYVGGSQYLDTVLINIPLQTLTAGVYELDPATGAILNRRLFPDVQNPISIGLNLEQHDNGLLISGSVWKLGGVAPASAVFETDWNLQSGTIYSYTDGSNFHYLATSVLSYEGFGGNSHALAGVRYLPASPDTTSSIIFFNSGAVDTLPLSPNYYGGPIVQIEEVNVLDTLFCSPTTPPEGCVPFVTGLVNRLEEPVFDLYPNPAREHVVLRLAGKDGLPVKLRLLDIHGRIVHQEEIVFSAGEYQIPISELSPGIYLVQLEGAGSRKLLVQ